MNSTKKTFLTSLMALLLCIVMLMGTTFAWFTDVVTSTGNIIQAGNLDAEMYYSESLENPDWKNADGPAVFNYENWEPGYTAVRYIKIKNAGNFNFKFQLSLDANGVVSKLGDVIDVYFVNPANQEIESLEGLNNVGILTNVIKNNNYIPGTLTPGSEVILAIALHMQEEAGNEYQKLELCEGGFDLKLIATQVGGESDSFGDDYDDNATWEDTLPEQSTASSAMELNADGTLPVDLTFANDDGTISITVPAGTKFKQGTKLANLNVNKLATSGANITLEENEETRSFDVHVANLDESNTEVISIAIKEFLPAGLNMGNYKLYHVEDGQTLEMQLLADGEAPVHNSFNYDPATGDVVLHLASFSEVALVADTENAWNGEFDYEWYDASKTELTIANADQLAAFGAIVGGMAKGMDVNIEQDSFEGKTVKLIADINLGDKESENNSDLIFYPIGYHSSDEKYEKTGVAVSTGFYNFMGTFDGNGNTISNFYQNTWEMKGDHDWYSPEEQYYRDGMGLFGRVYKGTIKNLTVKNFSSDGEIATTGVIAAYADGATFENIAIFNCNPRVYNIGNGGIVGCVGWYAKEADLKTTFKNITVDNSNKISALWGSYDVACGGIVGQYYPTSGQTSAGTPKNAGIDFENCHVAAQMDVYNDVCANYQYYAYRYAGMIIGSIRENTTNEEGKTIPDMTGITATSCTVNYGDWNDYYYCEFEKNSMASYSEDYQFSRVPHSELEFDDKNGNGVVDADERDSVTGCKHTHTAEENHQAIYLPFHQLFTGYGWGVSSIGLEKYSGIVTNLDITEGEQDKSVVKFSSTKNELVNNKEYKLSDIFTFVNNGVDVFDGSLSVTITNTDENNPNPVSIIFERDSENWKNGTISFEGTGEITITIQDYYFCTPTTITVNVTDRQPEEKFDVVMNNGDFLHRVGNSGTVALDKLFKAKDGVTVGTVSVTVEAVNGTSASGTYTNNAIQFNGTGVVKVTIKDDDTYCTPTVLYLEVVDATNVTGLSGTISGNVVLLNNCGISSLTVAGRNTVYGNGFTVTYSGDGRYLNNGLKQGVIAVSENGTLDNLRVVASIYPYMAFSYNDVKDSAPKEIDGTKTRYYYQLSAISVSGNATVTNCYVYGGRTNIFIGNGNVTIKDTILECGVAANAQIISSDEYTVTFENVTTIQKHVKPTVGTDDEKQNYNMLGAGILFGELDKDVTYTSPKLILNGDFKQYNWATETDSDNIKHNYAGYSKTLISEALKQTAFKRSINGNDAVNMGIIFLNSINPNIVNNTGLDYVGPEEIGITTLTGNVYSLSANASADQVYSDVANADRTTENDIYKPQFKYDSNLGGQYVAEGGDSHCYREGDTIKVMFPSGDSKVLNLAALVDIVKYSEQNLGLAITVKDGSGNAVTVTDGKITLSVADTYTVTYTVTDTMFYDKDGKTVNDTKTYSWDVTVSVSLKDKSVPDAYFEFDSSKQVMGYSGYSGNYTQFIPFLAGLKIYDYVGQNVYLRFNGDSDFTKVAKVELTASATEGNHYLITVTLTDGGVITLHTLARADSGGSKYTGSIKTRNNVIYYVNGGTTSASSTTWTIDYYKFTGNNGVEINSGAVKFSAASGTSTKPSSSFGTTIKYTATYDANGGDCGQTLGYATSNATAVTLPTPTRSGYTFMGWYTAASNGTRVGGAGDSYTLSANITLYAQWGSPCTVTYNANGGSCGTTSVKFDGKTLILPEATLNGKTFLGWYTAASGGRRVGGPGESYNPTGDITLYAQWQDPVTVTYNANGGNCSISSELYDGDLNLPTPTRTGYTFNGWYTAASGGTKIGDAGASYTPTENITLFAQWTINSYKVTISISNATVTVNGTQYTSNSSIYVEYGSSVSVTLNSFSQSNSKKFTITGITDEVNDTTTNKTHTFDMPTNEVTITASSSGSCLTPDTLVTLADGTQVRVDSLTGNEMLLVWNHETGALESVPVAYLVDHEKVVSEREIVHLTFSNGKTVKMIGEHVFFDATLNKYVAITSENANDFIGHNFIALSEDGTSVESVELISIEREIKETEVYEVVSYKHLTCFTEGILSTSAFLDPLLNVFDIDRETLTYDMESVQRDIETYGLYTYEDFEGLISEEAFELYNAQYLKIAVGKGYITWDDILELIDIYFDAGVTPIEE